MTCDPVFQDRLHPVVLKHGRIVTVADLIECGITSVAEIRFFSIFHFDNDPDLLFIDLDQNIAVPRPGFPIGYDIPGVLKSEKSEEEPVIKILFLFSSRSRIAYTDGLSQIFIEPVLHLCSVAFLECLTERAECGPVSAGGLKKP